MGLKSERTMPFDAFVINCINEKLCTNGQIYRTNNDKIKRKEGYGMKDCCEKCGKALGFFERGLKLNNTRINIQYDALCTDCHKILKEGIAQVDTMYQRIISGLKDGYAVTNLASVDVDTLIFLAAEALLATEPDYASDKTSLNQTLINRGERLVNKQEDMARIVYKVLAYGFHENLEKAGLDKSSQFTAYMLKNTLYLQQLAMNCSESVPRTYVNSFFSVRGFIAERIETKTLIYIPIEQGSRLEYTINREGDYTVIDFENITYAADDKKVRYYLEDRKTAEALIRTLEAFNTRTTKQEERRLRDIIDVINTGIIQDLRTLKPNEPVEQVPLDCVILCLMKNIRKYPEGRSVDFSDEEGLIAELLYKKYAANLKALSLNTRADIVDYLEKNCLYTERVGLKYNRQPAETGWAVFTRRGYIVAFMKSRQMLFMYEDSYPNDIYLPFNSMMLNGTQYLELPMDDTEEQALTGLVFLSKDIGKITRIQDYFELNNSFYQMNRYMEVENVVYSDAEKEEEVRRLAGRMFRDFGYVPFCLYDEWYTIQKNLRESDPLLKKLIPEKQKPNQNWLSDDIIYAPRITEAFKESAKELNTTLELGDLSVARALLWCTFKDCLIETLSAEWVRIGGDIAKEGDTLMTAFFTYSRLTEIEPAKTYYIGLYIYYLMDRQILPASDFLDNYEKSVQTFLECWREVKGAQTGQTEAAPAIQPAVPEEAMQQTETAEAPETAPEDGQTDPAPDA